MSRHGMDAFCKPAEQFALLVATDTVLPWKPSPAPVAPRLLSLR